MESCRQGQKTRDANITDGDGAPFYPEWAAGTGLQKWQRDVLPTLALAVRLAVPTWLGGCSPFLF